MYQRAVRGPIEGPLVVQFLLEHDRFPRSVRALLREIRRALGELTDPTVRSTPSTQVEAVLRQSSAASHRRRRTRRRDGRAAGAPSPSSTERITERYLRVGA